MRLPAAGTFYTSSGPHFADHLLLQEKESGASRVFIDETIHSRSIVFDRSEISDSRTRSGCLTEMTVVYRALIRCFAELNMTMKSFIVLKNSDC
jgi:hypothetical protein